MREGTVASNLIFMAVSFQHSPLNLKHHTFQSEGDDEILACFLPFFAAGLLQLTDYNLVFFKSFYFSHTDPGAERQSRDAVFLVLGLTLDRATYPCSNFKESAGITAPSGVDVRQPGKVSDVFRGDHCAMTPFFNLPFGKKKEMLLSE